MHRIIFISLLLTTWTCCAQDISLFQCLTDLQCGYNGVASDGITRLHCTAEHICVKGSPAVELCKEIYPDEAPSNSVAIGALIDSTNASDSVALQAYKLAIDQINALSDSDAPKMVLHICEISATPEDPSKSMQVLSRRRNAVAVVGPSRASQVQQIQNVVAESRVPIVSPLASADFVSKLPILDKPMKPVDGLFFRIVPADTVQAVALARQFPAQLSNKVALLVLNAPESIALKESLIEKFTPYIVITYDGTASVANIKDIQSKANDIIGVSPGAVIAITDQDSEIVVKSLLELQPNITLFMFDSARTHEVLNLANSESSIPPFSYGKEKINAHLKRTVAFAPGVKINTDSFKNFAVDFKKRWGTDVSGSGYTNFTTFTSYAYDAIYAVAIAVGAAGTDPTPERVAELLTRLNGVDTGTGRCRLAPESQVDVGPAHFRTAVHKLGSGSRLTLQGVTGSVCFSPHGDNLGGVYDKWTINVNSLPPTFTQ